MAGEFPGGGADRFRDAITFVTQMAAPPDEDQQVTFLPPSQLVYLDEDGAERRDQAGVPFDPEVHVERQQPDPIKVDCAVEYYDAAGQLLGSFGRVKASRVKVTLLDRDYVQVEHCDRIRAGGDIYWRHSLEPPSGLFDVGFYVLWFGAEQET